MTLPYNMEKRTEVDEDGYEHITYFLKATQYAPERIVALIIEGEWSPAFNARVLDDFGQQIKLGLFFDAKSAEKSIENILPFIY